MGKLTGSRRADLLLAGLALFCLEILLSLLATAATTEVSSAPAGKAVAKVDGEALARLDKDATSYPLTTPAEEARQTEEGPLRASLLSMLVVAVSPFFRSDLSLLARNCSLKGGVSHSLGSQARHNADLGIEAVRGVIDGGGNKASGNGDPRQCTNIVCN